MSERPKTLVAVAYHEAGHAVIAEHYGIGHRKVTIIPKDDYLGIAIGYKGSKLLARLGDGERFDPQLRRRIEGLVQVLYAGPIAEYRFRGRRNRSGAQTDL